MTEYVYYDPVNDQLLIGYGGILFTPSPYLVVTVLGWDGTYPRVKCILLGEL